MITRVLLWLQLAFWSSGAWFRVLRATVEGIVVALCLPDITRNTVCDALGWLWSTILATPVLRDSWALRVLVSTHVK